jgi:hypothetical protein
MSWREQISQIISRAKTFVYKTIGLYVQIKNHYKWYTYMTEYKIGIKQYTKGETKKMFVSFNY